MTPFSLALSILLLPALEPPKATVRLAVTRMGAPWTKPGQVSVVARPQDDSTQAPVEAVLSSDASGAGGELSLSPGKWAVQVQAAGGWAPAHAIEVTDKRVDVSVKLWPTARLVAPVAGRPASRPKAAVQFRGPPSQPDATRVPADSRDCEAVRGPSAVEVSCEVPAGVVDVRVAAGGYVPSYHWDLALKAGETRRLAALRQGASVVGYVQDGNGRPVAGASVRLQTHDGRPLVPALGPVPRSLESRTNERGFFQAVGMAPAEYRLVASSASGLMAMTNAPVERDRESALPDYLVVQPPQPMDVSVEPPLGPAGRGWTLKVIRLSPFEATTEHPVPEGGRTRIEGLSRGNYLVELMAGDGERWLTRTFAMEAAPAPLLLKVPIVHVKGTVKLRRDPLKASLLFGGRSGRGGKVVLESDEAGAFEGYIPRGGKWSLHISSTDPPVERALSEVEVKTDESGHEGTADIRLEDGRLKGRVVDEDGRGLKAMVDLASRVEGDDLLNQVFTDAEGAFELRGLAEGLVMVEAKAYRRQSQSLALVLSDTPTEVTLVLREIQEFEGRLVAADTGLPLPGVKIILWPADRPRTMGHDEDTDHAGRFRFTMPAGASAVIFDYVARGYPLEMGLMPLTPDRPLTMKAAPIGGTLTVELPPGLDRSRPEGPVALVLHNGAAWSAKRLRSVLDRRREAFGSSPAAVHPEADSRIVLSTLAPGEYALCWFALEVVQRSTVLPFDPARCKNGTLPAGGELTLKLAEPR